MALRQRSTGMHKDKKESPAETFLSAGDGIFISRLNYS